MFAYFESVIKTVLVIAAHCIILHIVVVSCCFYGTVNSKFLKHGLDNFLRSGGMLFHIITPCREKDLI